MADITPRPSRASIAPDLKLPPIQESSGPSSPTSTKSYKSRDNENPFRKNIRRASVATSVTPAFNSQVSARDSTPASSTRRLSLVERKSSIDLSKSERILQKVEIQRKQSIQKNAFGNKKFSFGSVGKRVTTILKAKNAFARLRSRKNNIEEETIADDKAFEIDSLPPVPRFASTLSVEAQYAMMKGYEDVVYSNLCIQYPEYRQMLRRNRTPMAGLLVSDPNGHHGKIAESQRSLKEREDSEDVPDGHIPDTTYCRDNSEIVISSTPKPTEVSSFFPREIHDSSPVPTVHQSPREVLTSSPLARSKNRTEHSEQPETKTKEKQLVMTYRYQRAMDILDDLRKHQGQHALSPRVKQNGPIEPLKEYNLWSYVWTHEFEPKANMKTAKA